MNREQILKEMNDIFTDVLDVDDLVLTDETAAEDVEEWDSLSQIILISEIEKHFHIKLEAKEVMECDNVGDMIDVIKGKLG